MMDASTGPSSSLLRFTSSHGILYERSKLVFAFRQRFPLQEKEQIVVGITDRDRPKPYLFDPVLLEQPQRVVLKTLQQGGEAAGNAMEDCSS